MSLPDEFFENSQSLNDVLDTDMYPYAPLFRNTNDNMYYTVPGMMSVSEEEAEEHGKLVEIVALGAGGSTEYTGIVVDLRALPLWAGQFNGDSGNIFPVIVIDWDRLH